MQHVLLSRTGEVGAAPVIGAQVVGLAIKVEGGVGDTIGNPADDSTKVWRVVTLHAHPVTANDIIDQSDVSILWLFSLDLATNAKALQSLIPAQKQGLLDENTPGIGWGRRTQERHPQQCRIRSAL